MEIGRTTTDRQSLPLVFNRVYNPEPPSSLKHTLIFCVCSITNDEVDGKGNGGNEAKKEKIQKFRKKNIYKKWKHW